MDAAALLLVATVGGRAPLGSASVAPPLEISAQRRTCQARPGRGGWSWRQVDGRRCWYRGRHRAAKAALAWPKPAEPDRRAPLPLPLPKPQPSIWDIRAPAAPPPRAVRTVAYPEGESWEPPPRLYAMHQRKAPAAVRPALLPGLFVLLSLSLLAAGVVTAGVKTIAAAARPLR
jgi:hypothetical protein